MTGRQAPLLSVRDLKVVFPTPIGMVHAVDGVSFDLEAGQSMGIVGESGSGKSTVARCIVRLINPTSGEIYIDDDEIAELPESSLRQHRRRVQIISVSYTHLTLPTSDLV